MEFFSTLLSPLFLGMDLMSLSIVIMFMSFGVMFWRAQAKGQLNWVDMLKKPHSSQISLTKLIQLVGGVVATWIMVKLTLNDKITWDLMAIYLAYVASVEGFSKFITAKYGVLPSGEMGKSSKKDSKDDDKEDDKDS